MKETTYIHAEGFSSGALKHGPLALINSAVKGETKIILIVMNDEFLQDNILTISEVHARNAYLMVITDCLNKLPKDKIDDYVEIPSLGVFTGVLAILPIQLLCYKISVLNGGNPDRPRNLAKCVTVN